ncbi:bifunctional lycopene cyclase/phytoene synthase-like [Rhopalosiphum maidis]|uniref:bifunctional lycopene cyclase/phytoene synthase-like n=1 Tax=Rhopalosiphum maidis TaxID=43146 RepID=UPI000F003FD4|nr:bifunctional lycopene cyclase/phytoene synthase-like [Rhopalosiphum maidis]
MLTYKDVHLLYTLPVIGVLSLIARPFINRLEIFKIAFISAIGLVYTTPLNNYIFYRKGRSYAPEDILGVIGHVPIEEYVFFVVQTVLTSLWALLCVRWSTPCLNFNYDKHSYQLIRWIPIAFLAIATVVGYIIAIPGQSTFYLGCVLWWVSPVVIFMWYGAGNFFIKKIIPCTFAIVVPTLYLCWIDQIALKENIWHINEKTMLNIIFVAEDLPFEEAIFFLISNVIVVLAGCCFDKARGMIETYTLEYPQRFTINWAFIRQLFWAFTTSEYNMLQIVTGDIKESIGVIATASKSFTAASFLFQSGIRLDLIILYSFCRVTDDMIDNELDVEKKKRKFELTNNFINELFHDRKSDYDVGTKPQKLNIDWTKYESGLTDVEMSCFRALSRIAFYLPRKPFEELLAGYKWDIEGRLIRNEDDLLLYSTYVAGSVGALCVYVMMYRCDNDKFELVENYDYVIKKAYQMGQALQLVNIARDIVTDSETLGRCYIPTEYMDDEDEEVKILCQEKKPRSLGDKKLKKYSTRMIHLANKQQLESVDAIKCLPRETRGSVLATTDIYRGLVSAIQSSPTYPARASLSKWNKIVIGFYSLYIKSIKYII